MNVIVRFNVKIVNCGRGRCVSSAVVQWWYPKTLQDIILLSSSWAKKKCPFKGPAIFKKNCLVATELQPSKHIYVSFHLRGCVWCLQTFVRVDLSFEGFILHFLYLLWDWPVGFSICVLSSEPTPFQQEFINIRASFNDEVVAQATSQAAQSVISSAGLTCFALPVFFENFFQGLHKKIAPLTGNWKFHATHFFTKVCISSCCKSEGFLNGIVQISHAILHICFLICRFFVLLAISFKHCFVHAFICFLVGNVQVIAPRWIGGTVPQRRWHFFQSSPAKCGQPWGGLTFAFFFVFFDTYFQMPRCTLPSGGICSDLLFFN